MAARKEILADLSTKIADGKMREAYRTFEELPVVDQIAVSISPGVGDAIAAYEVGEFGRRAKTNIESGDRLGAAGNIGLSALAGVSLIPLFRFLRGAKGVTKSGAKTLEASTKAEQPPVEAKLPPSAPKDSPLPEVEPFQKRPLVELDYRTGGGMDYQLNLGSKTRRWLNGYKQPEINSLKPSEQSKTVTEWIDTMKADNLPEGELKLLRLIDPDGSPSTRLLNETAGNKVISRGFLDDYMQRAQRDALQVRYVPNRNHQSPGSTPDYVSSDDQRQSLYFVRGTGEFRQTPDHYSGLEMADKIRGNNAYVFDADAFTQPGARYSASRSELIPEDAEKIDKAFANINLQTTDDFKEIFRIQSDFVKEATAKRKPKALRKKALIEEGGIQEIQAENFRGKKPDSDEIIDLLTGLDQQIMDLGVTEFSISPRDIERVTGRPFAQSLDKSPEEIFFMTAGPQGGRQKYFDAGPRVEDRVRAYFDDIVDIGTKDIEIANGVKILKKAVAAKTEGLPQSPYFKGGRDKYVTLPIRANILKAYNEGADGLSIGANQAMTEATQDTAEAVVRNYKDAAAEIKKVLKELGVDEKGVLETVDTGSTFDGTYLKFTPELLDAISKRGINAFKYGGAVDIDAMLAEL